MLCNPVSYYPAKIDEMTFFQDNNLEKIEDINHYNDLISQGKYSEASDYINRQEGIYGFFSDFYNLIENRIYTLQEYLLQKPQKTQPFIYYDDYEHFPINELHLFFEKKEETGTYISLSENDHESLSEYTYDELTNLICEGEEDLSTIVLFTNEEKQESIKDIFIYIDREQAPSNVNEDTIWI